MSDTPTRRQILRAAATGVLASTLIPETAAMAADANAATSLIIDTHQHMWDLSKFKLPWLDDAPKIYRQSYRTEEYREATRGLNVKAVYMEVDVAPDLRPAEADYVVDLCRAKTNPTIAATIGGRPDTPGFADYAKKYKATGYVKAIRQVLHVPVTPAGTCLTDGFVKDVRTLGELGLHFDLCMRPTELRDGAKLAELCPDTKLIVDHCGNADPKAFMPKPPDGAAPWHEVDQWKRDMEALAKRPNTICKISGIVVRAPEKWETAQLAPIVNFCLDTFGPDRVVFGGDWPVCLERATLRQWIDALTQIVAARPAPHQQKLWSENAKKIYTLDI